MGPDRQRPPITRRGVRAASSKRPDRRRAILQAARSLFSEGGYDALAFTVIAERAGVSRGSLYRHYPDRRSLLAGIIEHEIEQLVGRLTLRIPADGSLDAMLESGVRVFLDFVDERRSEYELLFGHTGRLDPEVALLLGGLRERLAATYRRLFKPVLERTRGEVWRDDESLLVTHGVMALAEGATLAWLADPSIPKTRVTAIVSTMIRQALVGDGGSGQRAVLRVIDGPIRPAPGTGGSATLLGVPVRPRRQRGGVTHAATSLALSSGGRFNTCS